MRPQVVQSANQLHPRVLKSRKHKRRHDARLRRERRKEFEGLSAENRSQGLSSHYSQIPVRVLRKQENSVSHSGCQNDHVQDHEKVYSNFGGTTEELNNGLGLNDLSDDLSSNEVENPKNSPKVTEFMKKIDDNVASSIDFADFMICLDGEHKTIGRYSFPLSLVPTVQRITDAYGDISAASLMNSDVRGKVFLFFCATIKEMEDLELHQITEEKLLKWRDAIKDALRINFKVDFAMHHLKKIARAYFGRIGSQVLQTLDDKLSALYRERAETYEELKDYLADAKDFHGRSLSTGLFL